MLTPKGRKKLQDAARAARAALRVSLESQMQAVKTRAAFLAPTAFEEAVLISRGESAESGAVVGTPEGGRFDRGGFSSLTDAIRAEPVSVVVRDSLFTATSGEPKRINKATGFYWETRSRGREGPSFPFDEHYVEAVEDGGVWIVIPRGPWTLNPEPGVSTMRMDKTLPPRRMFANAMAQSRSTIHDGVDEAVRGAVRTVGLA